MIKQKAFVFDLNGTMINDMEYHIKAWLKIVNDFGANIGYERMKEECYGKNQELLERIFPGRFNEEERKKLGIEKEKIYRKEFKPHLKGVNGLEKFLEHYHSKGIKMAIGSAAIMDNVDFVLDGLNIRNYFDALISADEVEHSKPDPETFLKAAQKLQLPAEDCLVFEDNPNGVKAAANAGMKAIVLTIMHDPSEFDEFDNIIGFAPDFLSITEAILATENATI